MYVTALAYSRRTLYLFLPVILLVLLFLIPPGCTSREELQASRDEAARQKTGLDDSKAKADAALAKLTGSKTEREALVEARAGLVPGSPEALRVDAAISEIDRKLPDLDARIDVARKASDDLAASSADIANKIAAADKVLSMDPNAPNSGTTIGGLVERFIPGGAGGLLTGAAGLAVYMAKLYKSNKDLKTVVGTKTTILDRVVTSIDTLAALEPAVRVAIEKHAPQIDKIQGAVAKAAVDEAQSRNPVIIPAAAVV